MTGTELIIALMECDVPLDKQIHVVGTDDFWAVNIVGVLYDSERDAIVIRMGRE